MRIPSLLTIILVFVIAAGRASAIPLTLEIAYPGMPGNAENEISSITLTENGGSFTHPVSNISPDLLLLVAQGTLLSHLTVRVFDAATSLGSFMFTNVALTGFAVAPDGNSDEVSFAFGSPGQGFYSIDYPGIPAAANTDIESFTLRPTSASFTHPISSISPQLLQWLAAGTLLPSLTLTPVDTASPFRKLAFEQVLFTSIVLGTDPFDLLEDVSFVFAEVAMAPSAPPMAEPSIWLMAFAGAVALRNRLARSRDV